MALGAGSRGVIGPWLGAIGLSSMMVAMTPDDIRALFELQHQASRAHIDVPLLVRRERLLRVQKMLD